MDDFTKWRIVNNFPNYEVSDTGEVRNIKTGRVLKQSSSSDYKYVCLCDGSKHSLRVHRLVAEAFIPNPDNLPFVNHKDENKLNNSADNLEWCTAQYNTTYGSGIFRRSTARKRKVAQYDLNGKLIKIWAGAVDAARDLNLQKGNISKCIAGIRNHTGGYIWKQI